VSFYSAEEIRELWMEYEQNATLEAKVVKDFDKVQFFLSSYVIIYLATHNDWRGLRCGINPFLNMINRTTIGGD
jgi:5'-deoxynucleotidase YfbR-like HD superfamily hydrolase